MTNIGNRIIEIRKKLGLTQREFSRKLGINQSTLSGIEKGKYNLSIEIIKKLAKEYDVNLYYLLSDDEEMFISPDVLSLTRIKEYAVVQELVMKFLLNFQKSHILQHYILAEYNYILSTKNDAIMEEVRNFDKKKKKDRCSI